MKFTQPVLRETSKAQGKEKQVQSIDRLQRRTPLV